MRDEVSVLITSASTKVLLVKEFKKALVQAGKDRLVNEIDNQLGKQIDEKLGDKVPEEIKDALKKPDDLLKGLGGLLGGKKEEEK